ncbi:MAG: NUDIX hydrolase [Vicingaceae bacterium]
MKNPWKTLKRKVIYENAWIKVEDHKVLTPAKKEGVYGTVHFKNLAIGIIPLTENRETFLVGQYRYPIDQYSWEIPEGGGQLDTPPLESAKRELKEETGLVAQKWTELIHIHTSNSVSDELGIIFLATELQQFEAEPEDLEDLTIKKLPFDQVFEMVLEGEITDSLTVAGILKAKYYLDHKLI